MANISASNIMTTNTDKPSFNTVTPSQPHSQSYAELWRYRLKHHRRRYIIFILTPFLLFTLYLLTHLTFYIRANIAHNNFMAGKTPQQIINAHNATPKSDRAKRLITLLETLDETSLTMDPIDPNDPMSMGQQRIQVLNTATNIVSLMQAAEPVPQEKIDLVNNYIKKHQAEINALKVYRDLGPVPLPIKQHAFNTYGIFIHLETIRLRITLNLQQRNAQAVFDDLLLLTQIKSFSSQTPSIEILENRADVIAHLGYALKITLIQELLNKSQLKTLQDAIKKHPLNLKTTLIDAYRITTQQFLLQTNQTLTQQHNNGLPKFTTYYGLYARNYTFVKELDHLAFYQLQQDFLTQLNLNIPYNKLWSIYNTALKAEPEMYYLTRYSKSNIDNLYHILLNENQLDLMRFQIARQLYYLDHNKFPNNLSELVPDYIEKIPQ
ncbi:hypothetical protein JD969_10460 [Planctomycetota bacterium]|nr:hypothetical protein JD969_10460 [Planctomycetota bacterium]